MRAPVRRTFSIQAGTSSTLGSNMIDIVQAGPIGAQDDSQTGDLLVTGVALIDLVDEAAIHQCLVWVGRTTTAPAQEDRGVRTRQFAANSQGIPFVLRFRGLRVDAGDILQLSTAPVGETVNSLVHQNVVSVKWSFRELAQG